MTLRAFTLIELLVVIAIIAILAAIIFPVFARAKDGAYRTSDITSMNSLRTALQLYRADQGAYPPALLGYVTTYDDNFPPNADVVPADRLNSFLYPRRVDSIETFRPSYNRGTDINRQLVGSTVWPLGQAGQRYGPTDPVRVCENGVIKVPFFYRVSGYDVASVPTTGVQNRDELRYALFWSNLSLGTDACSPGNGGPNDSPRQLGYSDPPEDTVVTWNSFFRDYDAAKVPQRAGKRDVVLFLGGGARPMDSLDVSGRAWQVRP